MKRESWALGSGLHLTALLGLRKGSNMALIELDEDISLGIKVD
jgi:hypothetical protein